MPDIHIHMLSPSHTDQPSRQDTLNMSSETDILPRNMIMDASPHHQICFKYVLNMFLISTVVASEIRTKCLLNILSKLFLHSFTEGIKDK